MIPLDDQHHSVAATSTGPQRVAATEQADPPRRWLRWVVRCLAALPLVLIVALWARSHRYGEAWVPFHESATCGVLNYAGGFYLLVGNGSDEIWTYQRIPVDEIDPEEDFERAWSVAGFVQYDTGIARAIRLPHYALALIALLPVVWPARRLLRRARGACRQCGYDLRASPDRCPECGTVAA